MKSPWTLAALSLALTGSVFADEKPVNFNRDIKPILSANCFSCHGPDEGHRKADLRLDTFEGATADGAVVPGKVSQSEIIARITSTDPDDVMPPPKSGPTLPADKVATLEQWVESGAEYERHWSFVPPTRFELPTVSQKDWPQNEIDHFVMARLDQESLRPQPTAPPAMLARRLFIDITGLPPQPEDVAAFTQNPDVEKLVDRLLASPSFGERWAAPWLDLSRYADSMGYASDNLRTIWAYRDWVIKAMNDNLPFDEFTRLQMAGDLVPEPKTEDLIATAFHRNTMNNTEGGTDNEEFRVAAVKDRINTTVQVWMGLTMRCAECHTHKYDPITQEEYYRFYHYFNQTADRDTNDDKPTIVVPGTTEAKQRSEFQKQIDSLSTQLKSYDAKALLEEQRKWEEQYRGDTRWTILPVKAARSIKNAKLTVEKDGAIFVSGNNPKNDGYKLDVAAAGLKQITGFRLETLPDKRLPGGGAGRSPEGRFFLNRFAAFRDSGEKSPQARFVRVTLPGKDKLLQLAEVEVFVGTTNIARQGKPKQSTTGYGGGPEKAVDGITNGDFNKNVTSHTEKEDNPWWELDLGTQAAIDKVVIWNRTDGGTGNRLKGYQIELLDANRKPIWSQTDLPAPKTKAEFAAGGIQQLTFSQSSASFSADKAAISNAAAPVARNLSGWDVTPKQAEPQEAVFVLRDAFVPEKGVDLKLELNQDYNYGGQLNLGKFRISASDDPTLAKRSKVAPDILRLIDKPEAKRSPAEVEKMLSYFRGIAPSLSKLRAEIAALQKKRDAIKTPTVPVMAELPTEQRRETFIQVRGSFRDNGKKIESAGVPVSFHPFPENAPANRAGIAEWLMDPQNPLTARVATNRMWAQLFGVGLVETEEDFGAQGTYPSHPELLDWLATEYIRLGWDRKQMIKTIVMSATYQQSSTALPESFSTDPDNRLMARGPRFRLDAEQVRDQALALSGLLVDKQGGPSVYPPQPPGMWRAAFNSKERTWPNSEGEDRYRRGLYTFWRRSVPYPSMATFDAPSREICNVRRIRTNTPLQAFVTLNDPVYVEIAQAMAKRILKEGGTTNEDRAKFALRLVKADEPAQAEIDTLLALLKGELSQFEYDKEAAKKFGGDVETAAWSSISNILLNLDAVLTKS